MPINIGMLVSIYLVSEIKFENELTLKDYLMILLMTILIYLTLITSSAFVSYFGTKQSDNTYILDVFGSKISYNTNEDDQKSTNQSSKETK